MYSPRISEDLIPLIYRRAKANKKPMTKVVDKILRDAFCNGLEHQESRSNTPKIRPVA